MDFRAAVWYNDGDYICYGTAEGESCLNTNFGKFFIEKALYPAMEKRKGNRTRSYIAEMRETAGLSPDELHALRCERLKKLLTACIESVPAYQNAALTAAEIAADPVSALRKIQPLSKRAFKDNPDIYLNSSFEKSRLILNTTGGSTGEPLKFYMDRYAVEHYEAARWRGLSWYGIGVGSRSVMVWGNPIELDAKGQKKQQFRDKFLKNRTIISAYELTEEKLGDYIRFLNSYQPEYLYGYASALNALSALLVTHKDELKLRKLKAVVSTAETLHEHQRAQIAAAFSCPVVNEYGARDAGILGYECPCGSLHLTAENVWLEVVDPVTFEPLPEGESGLVLTTDLNNLAMPRLRYILGDTATLSQKGCECGMTLPCIESLDGREDAMFKLPGGQLVHGHFIYHITSKYPSIFQVQIVQKTPQEATMRVVQRGGDAGELSAFTADIEAVLEGLSITVELVEDIPAGKSGKFRYAIREFAL